jgi:prepilin-type N-terminal cleavage/methylation domain-containing protein
MTARLTSPLSRGRPGFTLLEVSAVMAALGLAAGMLVVALAGGLKLEKASTGILDRLGTQRDLADQFRTDVAQAANAPPRWQEDVAGPDCLILGLGADRHVVYRWEDGRLVRFEFEGEQTHHREVALGGGHLAAEFERPRAGGRLITLRLLTIRKDGSKQPAAEIAAALGGDLQ